MSTTSNTQLAAYKAGERAASKPRSSRKKSRPAISLGLVLGVTPYAGHLWEGWQQDGVNGVIKRAPKAIGYDGYTKTWSMTYVKQSGILGLVAGGVAHFLANRLGVNRGIRKLTRGMVVI